MKRWNGIFPVEMMKAGKALFRSNCVSFYGRERDQLLFHVVEFETKRTLYVRFFADPYIAPLTILTAKCSCGEGRQQGLCRHMAAALLALSQKQSVVVKNSVKDSQILEPFEADVFPPGDKEKNPVDPALDAVHFRAKGKSTTTDLTPLSQLQKYYIQSLPPAFSYFQEEKILSQIRFAKTNFERAWHTYTMGAAGEAMPQLFLAKNGQGDEEVMAMHYYYKGVVQGGLAYFPVSVTMSRDKILAVDCACEYCKNIRTEKDWILCDHTYVAVLGLFDQAKKQRLGETTNAAGAALLDLKMESHEGFLAEEEREAPPRRLEAVLFKGQEYVPAWGIALEEGEEEKDLAALKRALEKMEGDFTQAEDTGWTAYSVETLLRRGDGVPIRVLVRGEDGEFSLS